MLFDVICFIGLLVGALIFASAGTVATAVIAVFIALVSGMYLGSILLEIIKRHVDKKYGGKL